MTRILNKLSTYIVLITLATAVAACGTDKNTSVKNVTREAPPQPTFKSVFNKRFTEVRRAFSSGYSFADNGYQIEPNWKLAFTSDTTVNIWNPKRKVFVDDPVTFDHDSVFNVAWAWLRLKKLTKDSIQFQVLQVRNKVIENDKSVVFMTLYADDYIRNVLHRDPAGMQQFSPADTAFIQKKSAAANADLNKAFSARQAVQLVPVSKLIAVERVPADTTELQPDMPPIDYMLPEFNITINKAYEDFHYAFSAWVDAGGHIIFRKSVDSIESEFQASYLKAMKGIVDGYLKAYLKVTPGSTLGIPHSSIIILNVTGRQ